MGRIWLLNGRESGFCVSLERKRGVRGSLVAGQLIWGILMKFAVWVLAAALASAEGCGVATSAELETPHARAYVPRHAGVSRIPRFVCNDDGRCWNSSLLKPEDYASGHLFLVNRVSKRAGYCVGYRYQYPVGWGECLGEWDHGHGRIDN
jgi:hypothetical protein